MIERSPQEISVRIQDQTKSFVLDPEAREDARETARKVWVKGMKLLKGGKHRMRNITDPDWEIIAVEGEKAVEEKDFFEGQEVDLIVTRSFSGISRGIKTIETYYFCKDNGGYVVKEIGEYLPRGLVRQRHETARGELENLLATMEKVK